MAKDGPPTVDSPTEPRLAHAANVAGGAAVEFVDWDDGALVRWHVREVDARTVPGTRGAYCLVFVCEFAVRRVWGYPADWRSLDGDGLVLLSWCR